MNEAKYDWCCRLARTRCFYQHAGFTVPDDSTGGDRLLVRTPKPLK